MEPDVVTPEVETSQPVPPSEPEQITESNVTPESEAPSAKAEPDPLEKVNRAEKRINHLTWKAAEAARERDLERAQRLQLQERLAALEAKRTEDELQAQRPRFEQYGDPQLFEQAVAQHAERVIAERDRLRREQDAQRAQQVQIAQLQQTIDQRITEAEQKFPDYREVVNAAGVPRLSENPAVFAALLHDEQMPELTYYLGKNPAELARVLQLPPPRALKELGRISAQLPELLAQYQTKAPPPAPTVKGGNPEVKKALADITDQDEYERRRRADRKARASGRR